MNLYALKSLFLSWRALKARPTTGRGMYSFQCVSSWKNMEGDMRVSTCAIAERYRTTSQARAGLRRLTYGALSPMSQTPSLQVMTHSRSKH